MAKAIIMPKLGLSMQTGTITAWHVKEGDYVHIGDILFSLETDKIIHDTESTAEGFVLQIVAKEGEEVLVTSPCCYVGEQGEVVHM